MFVNEAVKNIYLLMTKEVYWYIAQVFTKTFLKRETELFIYIKLDDRELIY